MVQPAPHARCGRWLRGQPGAERRAPRSVGLLRHRRGLRLHERAHSRYAHLHVELRGQPRAARHEHVSLHDIRSVATSSSATASIVNGSGADFPAPGLTSLSSTTARQVTSGADTLDNTVGVFAQEEVRVARPRVHHGRRSTRQQQRLRRQVQERVLSEGQRGVGDQRRAILSSPVGHDAEAARGVRRVGTGAASIFRERRCSASVPGPFGAGVTPCNIGNPNLGPERGYETEMGFDAALFSQSRWHGVHVLLRWNERRHSPAADSAVDRVPGTQFVNAGALTKHGFEVSLHGTPYQKQHRVDDRPKHPTADEQGHGSQRRRLPAGVDEHSSRGRILPWARGSARRWWARRSADMDT